MVVGSGVHSARMLNTVRSGDHARADAVLSVWRVLCVCGVCHGVPQSNVYGMLQVVEDLQQWGSGMCNTGGELFFDCFALRCFAPKSRVLLSVVQKISLDIFHGLVVRVG